MSSIGSRGALPLFFAALVAMLSAREARAAGFELTAPGAHDNGRAGASFVGADTPIGLFYNPATLLATKSRFNAAISLGLHFNDLCFRQVEVVEDVDTGDRTAGQTYPEVCGTSPVSLVPEIGTSFRIGDRFALGIGLYVPPPTSSELSMGGRDGRIDPDGDGGMDPILTPTRYLLIHQEQFQIFPTIGAAYAVNDRIRIGASFGWGFTKIDTTRGAFSRIALLPGIVGATNDAATHLRGKDIFVPRVQAGIWIRPLMDIAFEVGASFYWTDDVRVTGGRLQVSGLETVFMPDLGLMQPVIEGTVGGVSLTVPQVSRLAFGARYAQKLDQAADEVGDRLSTERFDVEADMVVTFGRNVDRFRVEIPPGAAASAMLTVLGIDVTLPVELPTNIELEHRWKNQVTIHLGGDYNPVPGLLGLRAGFTYQSRGVQHGYEQLDFTPFRAYGLHLGTTVRIAHKLDVTASYGHFFFPQVNVSVEAARIRRSIGGDVEPGDDVIVNAGRFRQNSDVLMIELGLHL